MCKTFSTDWRWLRCNLIGGSEVEKANSWGMLVPGAGGESRRAATDLHQPTNVDLGGMHVFPRAGGDSEETQRR